eukprot:5522589-Pyramimonas_sp.AAC.3
MRQTLHAFRHIQRVELWAMILVLTLWDGWFEAEACDLIEVTRTLRHPATCCGNTRSSTPMCRAPACLPIPC